MADKAKAADVIDGIQSLKDLGFRHAIHRDLDDVFRTKFYAMVGTNDKDKVSEEHRDQVFAGYMMRFNELHPVVKYQREGEDTFVPVTGSVKGKEIIEIGIAYAMSFSTHEFGRMKPNLKAIVGKWRTDFSVYRSGKWADLFKVKTSRERGATLEFTARLKKLAESSQKQNKVALGRGDPTAVGVEKLKAAWSAFFDALK
jgi:hypothetical protein